MALSPCTGFCWSPPPEDKRLAPLAAAAKCARGEIARKEADYVLAKAINDRDALGVTHENAKEYMDALIKYASID